MVRIISNKIIQRKTFLRRVKSSFRSKKSQKVFVPPDINVRVRPKSQGTKPTNKGDPEIIVRRSSRTSTDEESDSKPILYIYSTYNKPTKTPFQLTGTYFSAHVEYWFGHLLGT